jgi:hypothetical protein
MAIRRRFEPERCSLVLDFGPISRSIAATDARKTEKSPV